MQKNLNSAVITFLEREQINAEQTVNEVDCNVYSIAMVNPIARKFGMYKEMKDEIISIGDIIGFEDDCQSFLHGRPENVFEGLSMLFAEGENEYQNRSLSMLNYSRDEVVTRLMQSFQEQPMIVKDTGQGTYSVAGNGKHRFMLLRVLYLSELAKARGNTEEVEKIKNRYKIPVKVERLDFVKTYAKYFLMTYGFSDIVDVGFETKFHGGRTGHTTVETNKIGVFGRNEILILDDTDLIKYTKTIIQKNQDVITKEPEEDKNPEDVLDKKKLEWIQRMDILRQLPRFYKTIESFREFFDKNVADVYLGTDIQIGKGISGE